MDWLVLGLWNRWPETLFWPELWMLFWYVVVLSAVSRSQMLLQTPIWIFSMAHFPSVDSSNIYQIDLVPLQVGKWLPKTYVHALKQVIVFHLGIGKDVCHIEAFMCVLGAGVWQVFRPEIIVKFSKFTAIGKNNKPIIVHSWWYFMCHYRNGV